MSKLNLQRRADALIYELFGPRGAPGHRGKVIAALAEAVKVWREADWRPIATAPKDGSPILSWDGDVFAVVVWCGCKGFWALVQCDGNKPYDDPSNWGDVTHWMPISPPPANDHEREDGE